MGITFQKRSARLDGAIRVDEAEPLLAWLQANPRGRLNLSACTHLHAAVLQVLMACKTSPSAWPADPVFSAWLGAALQPVQGNDHGEDHHAGR